MAAAVEVGWGDMDGKRSMVKLEGDSEYRSFRRRGFVGPWWVLGRDSPIVVRNACPFKMYCAGMNFFGSVQIRRTPHRQVHHPLAGKEVVFLGGLVGVLVNVVVVSVQHEC